MREVLETITSPVWIFSVLISGITLNVISAYIKGFIDSIVSRRTTSRLADKEREKAMIDEIAGEAAGNSSRLLAISVLESRLRYRATVSFVICIGCVVILNCSNKIEIVGKAIDGIIGLFGIVMFFFAYRSDRAADVISKSIVKAAEQQS